MARRWWLTLLLFLLVAALAALAWLDIGGGDGSPRLTTLAKSEVEELRIQRRNRETLQLRRTDAGWQLLSPHALHASAFHVDQVLALLERPSEGAYDPSELDREAVELDPPRVRLSVNGEEVLLGASHPMGNRRYVQAQGRIHLVQEGVMPLLEGPWWNFIDRHPVLPGKTLAEVKTPDYHLRSDDTGWTLVSGTLPPELSPDELARAWQQASALVVREVQRVRGSEGEIRLRWADGGGRTLHPEQEEGEYRFIDREHGLAYAFNAEIHAFLLRAALPEEQP